MDPTDVIKESPIPQYILDDIIKNYVESISIVPSYGGKPFCDYRFRKKVNENCTFNDSSLIKLKKDAETYFKISL